MALVQPAPAKSTSTNAAAAAAPSSFATLARLVRYSNKHGVLLVICGVSALIAVVAQLAIPVLVGRAIDQIIGAGDVRWQPLITSALVILALAGVVALAQWLQGYTSSRLSYETVSDLRRDCSEKIGQISIGQLESMSEGQWSSRIVVDAEAVGDGLLQGIQQLFSGVITIAGTLIIMVWLSPAVALVVIATTPISVMVAALIARANTKGFKDQQRLQGELAAYAAEHIANARLISAFGQGQASLDAFDALNDQLNVVGAKAQFGGSLTNPGTRVANNIIYAAVATFGSLTVITGWPAPLTIGGVQAFLSYATQYTKPFNEISGVLAQVQTALASARRLFELLDLPVNENCATEPFDAGACQGALSFESVTFGYEADRPILRDISWQAKPAELIALVGPTGCGKTTLISLLLRFFDPDSGAITLDGRDIATIDAAELRSAFGMVLQESWLFQGTVHDNIAYGVPGATRQQVIEAAKAARAYGFIAQLPQGFDTLLGEGGHDLSEGQRQLIAIARVMLTDPKILLLDEATSSIDTRTELLIQEAFQAMMSGRTSIVVAHRLQTIRRASKILVMDQGQIIEQGTHEELLAKGGFYAQLFQSQYASFSS